MRLWEWLRENRYREKPQIENYIVEQTAYKDSSMEQRLRIVDKLLRDEPIDPSDPDLAGFSDPYWSRNGSHSYANGNIDIDEIISDLYDKQKQEYDSFHESVYSHDPFDEDPYAEMNAMFDPDPLAEAIEETNKEFHHDLGEPIMPPSEANLSQNAGIEAKKRKYRK